MSRPQSQTDGNNLGRALENVSRSRLNRSIVSDSTENQGLAHPEQVPSDIARSKPSTSEPLPAESSSLFRSSSLSSPVSPTSPSLRRSQSVRSPSSDPVIRPIQALITTKTDPLPSHTSSSSSLPLSRPSSSHTARSSIFVTGRPGLTLTRSISFPHLYADSDASIVESEPLRDPPSNQHLPDALQSHHHQDSTHSHPPLDTPEFLLAAISDGFSYSNSASRNHDSTETSTSTPLPSNDPSLQTRLGEASSHFDSQKDPSMYKGTSSAGQSSRLSFGPSFGQLPETGLNDTPVVFNSTENPVSTSHGVDPSQTQTTPAHPYGMYPQSVFANTLESNDDTVGMALPSVQSTIPIGFPGRMQHFQRVIAPDGEDQGIIDLDGHAEVLPPYSRYPPNHPSSPQISSLTVVAEELQNVATPTSSSRSSRITSVDITSLPQIPLVLPSPPLNIDESHVRSRGSTHSHTSNSGQDPGQLENPRLSATLDPERSSLAPSASTTSITISELKRKPKRKGYIIIWGRKVRIWYLLVIVCLLAVAIILGASLGATIKHETNPDTTTVSNGGLNLADGGPYTATTTTVALLPTGRYILNDQKSEFSQSDCVDKPHADAWSCDYYGPGINLALSRAPSEPLVSNVEFYSTSDSWPLQYGTQPFNIDITRLILTIDEERPSMGPAFHFFTFYDKIVLIPERNLSMYTSSTASATQSSASTQSAQLNSRSDGYLFRRRNRLVPRFPGSASNSGTDTSTDGPDDVQPGERLWVCFWNHTFIEGFFYAGSDSQAYKSMMKSRSQKSAASTTNSLIPRTAAPSDIPASTTTENAQYTSKSFTQASTTTFVPSPALYRRDTATPAPFPKVARLEERRLKAEVNTYIPFCQLVIAIVNPSLRSVSFFAGLQGIAPILDGTGKEVVFNLAELTPSRTSSETGTSGTAELSGIDVGDADNNNNGVADQDDQYLQVETTWVETVTGMVPASTTSSSSTSNTPTQTANVSARNADTLVYYPRHSRPGNPHTFNRRMDTWANACQCQWVMA